MTNKVGKDSSPRFLDKARKWGLWLVLCAVFVALAGLVLVAILQVPVDRLVDAATMARVVARLGVSVQILLAAAIVWKWRRIVAWGRRMGYVTKAEHRQVIALRPSVAALLAAYLLLIPIGPGSIAGFFLSMR